MATTENFLNGDGTTTEFGFSFPYIKTEDVRVELQEIDSTEPINDQIKSSTGVTNFTIPSNNPTLIQFDSLSAATNYQAITGAPLANHAVNTGNTIRIRIYRSTSSDQTPATFFSGGAIRSQDLNNNFDSILYINQEKENELTQIIAGGIADGSITSSKLADQSVGTAALIDGGIATVDLADNAVTTAKIINDAVTTDKIVDDAVTTSKIVNDAVTSAKIADGTILNINVNTAAAIDGTKISPDFGAQNIITTGSVGGGTATFSGDVLQYTTLKTPYCLREPDFDTTGVLTTQKIYDLPTWANRFTVTVDGAATTGSNLTYLVQFGSATAFWNHSATFVNNPSSAYSLGNWVANPSPSPASNQPTGAAFTTGGFAIGLIGYVDFRSSSHNVFIKMLDRWSSSGLFQYEANTANPSATQRGSGNIFTNPVDFIDTPTRIRIVGNALSPISGKFGVTWFSE